jgi:hypothetical protein
VQKCMAITRHFYVGILNVDKFYVGILSAKKLGSHQTFLRREFKCRNVWQLLVLFRHRYWVGKCLGMPNISMQGN